ncbi:hypothetical protein RSOLAG22IIIB_05162 [Rhizoctonia solani]|uniref:Helicase ATP-binding domain-containing protein n=1 Tax=Rhizoctonia solani TaxID=456999 RepID=A0A0K6G4B0_9AGAM|nr:hypothetical protein RSOLAG22IIIB_05162 [Rhizoctonia solani]
MTTPWCDSTPSPELDPATDALHQRIIEETRKHTGKTPYDWQVQFTLDKLAGKDTFVIAGTGAGKLLTFAMVLFMVPKSITWLLAPLNYIEEQLVKDMEKQGVTSVAINQNSNWEEEKRVHLMKGGSKSYKELIQFFPDPNSIPKMLIFVDRTHDTHVITTKLQKHLGIEGTPHWDKVQLSEAFTMGVNFDDVKLVIQLPAPNSTVTHVQRIGQGGWTSGTRCRGVMIVTPNQYQQAIQLCADIKDMQPDDLLNAKVKEEDLDELEGVLAGEQTQATDNNGAMDEPCDKDAKKSSKTGLRAVNLHNPEHISCYEAGTCDLCVARLARDKAANETNTHTQDQALKREEIKVQLDARGEAIEEPKQKRPPQADNWTGKELQRFTDQLKQWRRKVFRAKAETRYLGIKDIMIDKAMEAIKKCKSIKDILDLDRPEPPWPQQVRWGGEVVGIVLELTSTIKEDKRKATKAEQEQKEAERREKDKRQKAEKEAKRLAQQQEQEAKRATNLNVPWHMPTSNIHTPPQAGPSNQTPGGSFGPAIVAQSPAWVVIGPDVLKITVGANVNVSICK